MSTVAAERMASRLTLPFERGADTLELRFSPGATSAAANVAAYDFSEHIARFSRYNQPPDPRYVLTARSDVVIPTRIDVDFEVVPPATPATGTVKLDVPAATRAGMSFALDLGANDGPFTRIRTLRSTPGTRLGTVADAWSISALLGNLAKLLWAAGWERDALRAYFDEVRGQNRLRQAVGKTLDLFGYDLGVQRFPPLPYAFEEGTVALYHLDDQPVPPANEAANVENAIKLYGGRAHPGTNVVTGGRPRAQSRAVGRFGAGFLFRDDDAQITIPDDSDFALATANDFTVECFVNPDDVSTTGHILTKHPNPTTNTNAAGWALSVGEFGRGITRNVRFLLGDGIAGVMLFLDETLGPFRFYHLAAVIDRAADEARLFVDGRLRSSASIAALGALTNSAPITIGSTAGEPFKGVIDEVRLSRAARSAFHPVLGESDESYRRRLLVFARWTLPAPPQLLAALNDVAGPIGNDPAPFVIEERNAPLNIARRTLTIYPDEIGANQHIAANGDRHAREPAVNGVPRAEEQFDPLFLVEHTGATYAAPPPRDLEPAELPPNPRRMQLATARALDRLLALSGPTLLVESAFDPRAADLRAVGRAVHLTHDALALRELAALAHRAGFSWVLHDARAGQVYASVAPADYLEVAVTGGTPTTATGFDLLVGEQIDLTALPSLATSPLYKWSTIACGAGRARFLTDRDAATVTIEATAPGELAVQIEVTLGQRLFTTTRTFRIGLAQLADGQSIDARGRLDVDEKVAGSPADEVLQPTSLLAPYLLTFDDGRATYGGSLENRRMQPAVAERLVRLLDLIGTPVSGTLHVAKTIGSAAGLEPIGRSLTLDHASVPAGELGALCNAAGFTYVRRQGNRVLVLQRAGELVGIDTTPSSTTQLAEGSSVRLSVRPRAGPSSLAVRGSQAFLANRGTDVLTQIDVATGRVQALVKVGWEPVAVAAAPAPSTRVYTADRSGRTVTAVDAAANAVVGAVDVGARPVALTHHPTSDRLFVALQNGDLADVDGSATPPTVTRTVALGAEPLAVSLTPNGDEAWVALANDSIAVVDTATFAAPAIVALPATPQDLAVGAARAYVTLPAARGIAIVDVGTRAVGPPITFGTSPGPIALAADGSKVYVVDTDDARLYLREPNGDPDRRFPVGRVAVDAVAGPDRVYVVTRSTPGVAGVGADGVTVVDASDADVVAGWTVGTGLGETLTWTIAPAVATEATLSSTTASEVELTAERAGPIGVRAVYVAQSLPPPAPRTTAPYTFEVRLKDQLQDDPKVVIRKEQYALVMNVLNAFHPVGVEVITQAVREKVIEVREGLMEVFPAYTFPEFRVRGPNPALERRAAQNGDSRRE
jgi:DNA-binding beta-propeller fold protein YncE